MARNRRLPVICAALIAVAAWAGRADAAPGIAAKALDHPALAGLPRIGTIIVGHDNVEARAGRDYAAASLSAAGHQVVTLPTSLADPRRRWLLDQCAAHDLDAVALVRISTEGSTSHVNVDIEDPEGNQIPLGTQRQGSDTLTGGGSPVTVFASFWFQMNDQDVAARTSTEDPIEDETNATATCNSGDCQPRLWVSRNYLMLGSEQIRNARFYDLVGRPDLKKRTSLPIVATRSLGYAAIGVGVTGVVMEVVAMVLESGVCYWPNAIDQATGQPQTCGGTTGVDHLVAPLAVTAVGGVFVAASYAMASDPVSLETRKALARAYNARLDSAGAPSSENARPAPRLRLSVAAGPLAHGDGGVMLINGRF